MRKFSVVIIYQRYNIYTILTCVNVTELHLKLNNKNTEIKKFEFGLKYHQKSRKQFTGISV